MVDVRFTWSTAAKEQNSSQMMRSFRTGIHQMIMDEAVGIETIYDVIASKSTETWERIDGIEGLVGYSLEENQGMVICHVDVMSDAKWEGSHIQVKSQARWFAMPSYAILVAYGVPKIPKSVGWAGDMDGFAAPGFPDPLLDAHLFSV